MLCQTIKKDKECYFWSKSGCVQDAGQCHAVVEKCEGCAHIDEWPAGKMCDVYASPENQWTLGICNMATHIKIESEETQKMVNPLKASKRMGGRR